MRLKFRYIPDPDNRQEYYKIIEAETVREAIKTARKARKPTYRLGFCEEIQEDKKI